MTFRQAVEPWYLACALLSFTTTGIVPILMPLAIHDDHGNALSVGLVTAAMGAGMLTAPVWGGLADRHGWHRPLMVGGGAAILGAIFAFRFADLMWEWLLFAFLMGCGIASVFTIANLLIVSVHPEEESEPRISWLQTIISTGTVAGLVAAGTASDEPEDLGFLIGVFAAGAACLVSLVCIPRVAAQARRDEVHGASAPASELWAVSPKFLLHYPLESLWQRIPLAFRLFLAVWFLASLGINAINALYPLLMNVEFGVSASLASYTLAAATAGCTGLFLPAGALVKRLGTRSVLSAGLALRTAGLVLFTLLADLPIPGRGMEALLVFFVIQLSWPLMSVSSTLMVAKLAPGRTGPAMGLYNGMNAAASLVGPVLGGHLADRFGYAAVPLLALAGVGLALLLMAPLARAVLAPAPPPA